MTKKTFEELGGESWRIRRFVDESDKRWSAFNPCIAYSPVDGYVVLMRSSNYFFDPKTGGTVATIGTRVKNRVFMAKLNEKWEIIEDSLVELYYSVSGQFLRGPEDGRLFWRDGSWHILSVMREPYITADEPRIGTFRVSGSEMRLIELHLAGDLQPVEKNWMPTYEKNPEFDFVYSSTSVYKIGLGKESRRDPNDVAGNNVRGGSCLWDLGDGTYLAIVHEVEAYQKYLYIPRLFSYGNRTYRKYLHRFARYSKNGTLLQLSDLFTFQDVDIEFAAGLVVSGDDVIVSYGYKDVAAYLGRIKLTKVLENLHDISS